MKRHSSPNEERTKYVKDLIFEGKVRRMYEPNGVIFLTTNNISAFDQVLGEVDYKGNVLNCVSTYCKKLVEEEGILTDYIDEPDGFFEGFGFTADEAKRCTYAAHLDMIPFEVIVRGILTGSAAAAHAKGVPYCGYTFPKWMKDGDRFEEPIVTLTTKEIDGHDMPITIEDAKVYLANWFLDEDLVEIEEDLLDEYPTIEEAIDNIPLSDEAAEFASTKLEEETDESYYALGNSFDADDIEEFYNYPEYFADEIVLKVLKFVNCYNYAAEAIDNACQIALEAFDIISRDYESKGFVLVDSKFEFGLEEDMWVVLADEVGTMDSSRIIDKKIYEKTGKMVNHDKQPVRDDLKAKGFVGDPGQVFPGFSKGVLEETSINYIKTCIDLVGVEFAKEFLPKDVIEKVI